MNNKAMNFFERSLAILMPRFQEEIKNIQISLSIVASAVFIERTHVYIFSNIKSLFLHILGN